VNHDAEDETERRVRVCGWTTQVKSGHYVRVKPDPLPLPSLVVHSAAMADALGLSEAEVATERFAKFFSGDMAQVRLLPFSPPIPRPLHLPTVPSQSDCPEVPSEFAAFFYAARVSRDAWTQAPGMESWATPYALSIMGQAQYRNCPFGNGNGYGDGRAISVGEVNSNQASLAAPPPLPLPSMYLGCLEHGCASASMHRIARLLARSCRLRYLTRKKAH